MCSYHSSFEKYIKCNEIDVYFFLMITLIPIQLKVELKTVFYRDLLENLRQLDKVQSLLRFYS